MVWGREHICCSWEVNTDSWLPWWSWALGDSWHRTWRGMAGILHYRVGKAEVVGDGRGRHLQSDPASGPLSACWGSPCPGARGRERTEGPGHWGTMREVVLSHISHQLSTALSSMSPAIPASFHRALACWVSLCLLSASQSSGVPLLPAARHAGQCQATSPASPRQGCSQPAAVAALQGVLQGSEHSVHVVTG